MRCPSVTSSDGETWGCTVVRYSSRAARNEAPPRLGLPPDLRDKAHSSWAPGAIVGVIVGTIVGAEGAKTK